jgi:hypothetical protein
MEKYMHFFLTLEGLIIISVSGMLMNFLKKKIKGETIVEIKDYFKNHFKSTVIAVFSTVLFTVAYKFTLAVGQPVDILSVIGIGYACDDLFNKWDKTI